MKKIPYGISNFKSLIESGYYFEDKTRFIELLEKLDTRFHFLLRPRRFGKSLFVSMLRYYYGIEHKADFEKLFGGLHIGKKPTPKANAYRVMFLEFSRIDTSTPESTYNDFLRNVREGAREFMHVYSFPTETRAAVLSETSPAGVIAALFGACAVQAGPPLYITIDEYDHFANEILAFNFKSFAEIVSRNGFVRKFYEALKTATGTGIVERLFVTGVTPITLDSLTSGFNIRTDLSRDPRFNEAMGFTESEVLSILDMICEGKNCDTQKIISDMRRWHNGYMFSEKARVSLYNPVMTLYFANDFKSFGEYPRNIVDHNISTDYGKLGRLFHLQTPDDNFKALEEIVAGHELVMDLTEQFSFERPFTRRDFVSMLYYMGFLTIKDMSTGVPMLSVPNYVTWRLYVDFAAARLDERVGLGMGSWDAVAAMLSLARHNDPSPLFEKMQETMKKLSARDAIKFDEKHLKMIFISLVNLTEIYFIRSEAEVAKKYADVMLLERLPVTPEWQFAFEFKYVKKEDAEKAPAVLEEAKVQLKGYLQSPEWNGITNLRAYVVVFVYDEMFKLEEI